MSLLLTQLGRGRRPLWPGSRPLGSLGRSASSLSPAQLRHAFVDHFTQSHAHQCLPATPIIPPDPSLSFVNAGMNQLKDVFLGHSPLPPEGPGRRLTNIQKCVRMSDWALVGKDETHHTFFEMMGNWSLSDYYKRESCRMAWELLIGPMQLPADRLHVTYFGGCPRLGLPADLETRDIWLSLGLPESRVRPAGPEDNFWAIGDTGPCGASTEIYFDHDNGQHLVELWNLVFVEFNRRDDGSLESLPHKHVDTGLGLERLAAASCGSRSNYDSQLFRPLIERAEKATGAPAYAGRFGGKQSELDTAYRQLADHSRMIAVCLADGMVPDSAHRLRQVIRKTLRVARDTFRSDHNLLIELCKEASENLADQYPEMSRRLPRVETILEFEGEHYLQAEAAGKQSLSKLVKSYPEAKDVDVLDAKVYHDALRFIDKHGDKGSKSLSGELGFKMYDSLGTTVENLIQLAEIKGLSFDPSDYDRAKEAARQQSRSLSKASNTYHASDVAALPKTDDSYKHMYSFDNNKYQFPMIHAQVVMLSTSAEDGKTEEMVSELKEGQAGVIYLDQTTFYAAAGGQDGDCGEIRGKKACFEVEKCVKVGHSVAHIGKMVQGRLGGEDKVTVRLNPVRRVACMQNHTGTHLLNAALHDLLPLTCQRSSHVSETGFRFDFNYFNAAVNVDLVSRIEAHVNSRIEAELPVTRKTMERSKFLDLVASDEVITLPGETYPDEVSVIRVHPSEGRPEACCGTHVLNTGHVQAFAVVGANAVSTGVRSFKCVTGPAAVRVRKNGIYYIEGAMQLNELVEKTLNDVRVDEDKVRELCKQVQVKRGAVSRRSEVPYTVRSELTQLLDGMLARLRPFLKKDLRKEFQMVLEDTTHLPYLVHYFEVSSPPRTSVNTAMKMCQDKPAIWFANWQNKEIVARACVPSHFVTETFDAQKWIDSFAGKVFGSEHKIVSKRKLEVACQMSATFSGAEQENVEDLSRTAMEIAEQFAEAAKLPKPI